MSNNYKMNWEASVCPLNPSMTCLMIWNNPTGFGRTIAKMGAQAAVIIEKTKEKAAGKNPTDECFEKGTLTPC